MDVSVAEAKNKLTQLLQLAEKGERITICRDGQPVVDLVPTRAKDRKERVFGARRVVIIDPGWAKPQNDAEAWLQGEV